MDLNKFKTLSKKEQKSIYDSLKIKKDQFTSSMINRCSEDVKINDKLFYYQTRDLDKLYDGNQTEIQR